MIEYQQVLPHLDSLVISLCVFFCFFLFGFCCLIVSIFLNRFWYSCWSYYEDSYRCYDDSCRIQCCEDSTTSIFSDYGWLWIAHQDQTRTTKRKKRKGNARKESK